MSDKTQFAPNDEEKARKLEAAAFIFEWLKDFTRSERGKHYRDVSFVVGQQDYPHPGCVWIGHSGFGRRGWHLSVEGEVCKTPEKLASLVKLFELEGACEAIKTGKIWENYRLRKEFLMELRQE